MTAATVAARRATAARMSRDGASLRAIAAHLNVSKDTVRRDLAAIERDTMRQPDQHKATPATPGATDEAAPCDTTGATDETPDATPRQTREQRVAVADMVMRHLGLAVTATVDACPSHVIVSDTTAHRWATELRAHITALTALADAFDEYYPTPPAPPIAHPYGVPLDKDHYVASH